MNVEQQVPILLRLRFYAVSDSYLLLKIVLNSLVVKYVHLLVSRHAPKKPKCGQSQDP